MAEGVFVSDVRSRVALADRVWALRGAGCIFFVAASLSLAGCGKSESKSVPPTAAECVQMADRMYPEPADAEKREDKLERCLPSSN